MACRRFWSALLWGFRPPGLYITVPGRTVHNSHYLATSFLYQLQDDARRGFDSPNVMDGKIVQRQDKELYIDLDRLAPGNSGTLPQIASSGASLGDIVLLR